MRASRRDSERHWREDGVSAGSSTMVRDGTGCRGHSKAQAPSPCEWNESEAKVVDTLERFPLVWWLKMKNLDAPAVKRESEEDWGR